MARQEIKTGDVLKMLEKLSQQNAEQADALAALASVVQCLNATEEPRPEPRARLSVPALKAIEPGVIVPDSVKFAAMRAWAQRVRAAHKPGTKWDKKLIDPRFFAVLSSDVSYDPAHARKVREAFAVLDAAGIAEAKEARRLAAERA